MRTVVTLFILIILIVPASTSLAQAEPCEGVNDWYTDAVMGTIDRFSDGLEIFSETEMSMRTKVSRLDLMDEAIEYLEDAEYPECVEPARAKLINAYTMAADAVEEFIETESMEVARLRMLPIMSALGWAQGYLTAIGLNS